MGIFMRKALVMGGGGFIGHHMVKRLKLEGYFVRSADLKYPEFSESSADEFFIGDFRNPEFVRECLLILNESGSFDEIYQFAADMGGAGFVFTGENDADIMHNSALINLNLLDEVQKMSRHSFFPIVFYSSSACMYPLENQLNTINPILSESSAYPANPDSEYGWEKLFSERLYLAYQRNYSLNIKIARYHNIFGPEGTWEGGREKAPAAICRKIVNSQDNGTIEVWGDGEQTRSFLFIDDCIEATRRLVVAKDFAGPVNIGSEHMVSINELVSVVSVISGKKISIRNIDGPVGVRGRTSDNTLIKKALKWNYEVSLQDGLIKTYDWIYRQIEKSKLKAN